MNRESVVLLNASSIYQCCVASFAVRIARWSILNKLHISGCSVAALWGWGKLIGFELRSEDLVIVPFAMQCIYQWNRLTDRCEDQINCPNDLHAALQSERKIRTLRLVGIPLILTLASLHWSRWSFVLLISALVLGFLYGTPLFARWPRARLKNIFLVKNLTASLMWAMLTVLYPAFHTSLEVDARTWLAFLYMFSAVFMVEVIWDIRDAKGDARAGIRTLPVLLGLSTTQRYLAAVNICSGSLVLGAYLLGHLSVIWVLVLSNTGLIFVWIHFLLDKIRITRLWADVLIILQTLLLLCIGLTIN